MAGYRISSEGYLQRERSRRWIARNPQKKKKNKTQTQTKKPTPPTHTPQTRRKKKEPKKNPPTHKPPKPTTKPKKKPKRCVLTPESELNNSLVMEPSWVLLRKNSDEQIVQQSARAVSQGERFSRSWKEAATSPTATTRGGGSGKLWNSSSGLAIISGVNR